jgi:hypothetical protein
VARAGDVVPALSLIAGELSHYNEAGDLSPAWLYLNFKRRDSDFSRA